MKTDTIQQEILLISSTSFSKREWCKSGTRDNNSESNSEKLEEACWNGMLEELLPEILEHSASGDTLRMWKIRQGDAFLQIELGELPKPTKEDSHSIFCFTGIFLS